MSTSGTVVYRPTAETAINTALRKVGAIDPENSNTPTSNQTSGALTTLNMMLKSWQTFGLQLWEKKYTVVFPQLSQGLYVLGSPGPAGDHASVSSPLNGGFVQTTLSAAAASGASTISVTTVTGQLSTVGNTAVSITNAYNIGVQLDSGAIQWTAVNGAPSGTTVTLTATLTGAASSGNYVFCYQTKAYRPLRVTGAFIRDIAGGTDTHLKLISKDEYNRSSSKTETGTPTRLYYDQQANTGHIYLLPEFADTDKLLFIEFQKPIEDLAAASEDWDLPQEWAEPVMWNLAWRLAPEYEVSATKYNELKEFALYTLEQLKGWDQETSSIFIQPGQS